MSDIEKSAPVVPIVPASPPSAEQAEQKPLTTHDFEEFEIGEHQVPWFLWVFFTLIVTWASVSWIKFFGY